MCTCCMSTPELALLGFFIGLTGALAPGPTLIATIQSALHLGWSSGPRVTAGHIIVEFVIVLMIAAGLSALPGTMTPFIAGIGGGALILFGGLTLSGAKKRSAYLSSEADHYKNPVFAGIITSVSNPYFWIWWFSVGSALLVSSLSQGIAGLAAFITGHWLADLSWFTLVSVSIHQSRTLLTDRSYRALLVVCGILLVVFGIWFIVNGVIIPANLAA